MNFKNLNVNLPDKYFSKVLFSTFLLFFICLNISAQSTTQDSPTPVSSNEISGTIQARAIGDPRLTNYYYTFNGNQGDVFVNVLTKNLDGDIDIFTVDGLNSLTKIRVFSDVEQYETGRVIYLRKSEKIILRIQGRSPNDDPATFQIKFAGSFAPVQNVAENNLPKLPEIDVKNQGESRVNSVGTIIDVIPKPTPKPTEVVAKRTKEKKSKNPEKEPTEKEINIKPAEDEIVSKNTTMIEIKKGGEEEVSDQEEISGNIEQKNEDSTTPRAKPMTVVITDPLANISKEDIPKVEEVKTEEVPENVETTSENKSVQPVEPEKLANIQLVVQFKDGKKFKRSMDKITWFNVDKGILTIVVNNGQTLKFSMLDVDKMTFETEK